MTDTDAKSAESHERAESVPEKTQVPAKVAPTRISTADSGQPSESRRWEWTAIILVSVGLCIVAMATLATASTIGAGQIAVLVGVAISAAGLLWFRRQLSQAERDFIKERTDLKALKNEVEQEQSEFDAARRVLEKELQDQLSRIEQRGKSIADRMIAFHEWMEFPQPIDLRDAEPEASELLDKDRQVLALMDEESKRLFEKIRKNEFRPDGKTDTKMIREEILGLMQRIARVYRPDIENPFLETSAEQLLRALSRASLHLLIVFDQLPLDAKTYNIQRVYDYIRRAVQAYGAYKSASPYLSALSRTWYVGRVVSASNPITLGAWWGASELGKYGAQKLATRFINQQAVNLLHDGVRVIGYEVAAIYGSDFRHRDANWIYGVELTELLSTFPTSREAIMHGLDEVGRLPLRNEYDRIFLYRSIAAHKSAGVMKSEKLLLSLAERQQVAHRLESALQSVIHGKSDSVVMAWKKSVEIRLGVQVRTDVTSEEIRHQAELDAVRSLVAFVVAADSSSKLNRETILAAVQQTQTWKSIPLKDEEALLSEFQHELPGEFLPAEFDPDSDQADHYLADLVQLGITLLEFDTQVELAFEEVAAYFRQDPERTQKRIDDAFRNAVANQLDESSPVRQPSASSARAAMLVRNAGETIQFLYPDITLHDSEDRKLHLTDAKLSLVGTDQRWFVVAESETPSIIWTSNESVDRETVGGYLANSVKLSGGVLGDSTIVGQPTVLVPGVMTARFESYFAPLITNFPESPTAST